MIKQAVILCAGKGTRLGIVTSHKAKPLVEVANKPFICWILDDLVNAEVKDIVLLVGYMKEQFNFLREIYPEVRLVESDIVVFDIDRIPPIAVKAVDRLVKKGYAVRTDERRPRG